MLTAGQSSSGSLVKQQMRTENSTDTTQQSVAYDVGCNGPFIGLMSTLSRRQTQLYLTWFKVHLAFMQRT